MSAIIVSKNPFGAQAPTSPSPYKGRGRANAAGEGTADERDERSSFLRRQESIRRASATDGARHPPSP